MRQLRMMQFTSKSAAPDAVVAISNSMGAFLILTTVQRSSVTFIARPVVDEVKSRAAPPSTPLKVQSVNVRLAAAGAAVVDTAKFVPHTKVMSENDRFVVAARASSVVALGTAVSLVV